MSLLFFFFNHSATPEIYTLSLHDALPILGFVSRRYHDGGQLGGQCRPDALIGIQGEHPFVLRDGYPGVALRRNAWLDRKSTRLNSSHTVISYAVFCLKKKKINKK